jgi:hypothetical protein
MSGGPNSPVSEILYDEDTQLMIGARPYDSPLSRSMTAFGADNDPFSLAAEAATTALSGLEAELENIQLRGVTSFLPGAASDSEDVQHGLGYERKNADFPSSSSFVTKDLLNILDDAIAFSSSSVYDTANISSSGSSTENAQSRMEAKKFEEKIESPVKPKKTIGDRSRNASGVEKIEKKLSREEDRRRHESDSPGPTT